MSQAQTKEEIQLNTTLVVPVLLADKCQMPYLRIGLTGFHLHTKKEPLVPVNMGLIIDTSNSMIGLKIDQAKKAAMMIVKRLRPTDLITLIALDHQGKVLLPTTRAQDQEMIAQLIQTLGENRQTTLFDSTALFEGLEKGTTEVFKYRQLYQINRMILLSDGFANVGPHSPTQFSELARVLGKQNVTLTTIGFGPDYNQDLMRQLSQQSDGNHAVANNATDMNHIIEQEFAQIASVVAQKVEMIVTFSENARPVQVLGREAKIEGQTILVQLNQLHSEREKYILVELEIPPLPNQQPQTVAELSIGYCNLKTSRYLRLDEEITMDKSLIINC